MLKISKLIYQETNSYSDRFLASFVKHRINKTPKHSIHNQSLIEHRINFNFYHDTQIFS